MGLKCETRNICFASNTNVCSISCLYPMLFFSADLIEKFHAYSDSLWRFMRSAYEILENSLWCIYITFQSINGEIYIYDHGRSTK